MALGCGATPASQDASLADVATDVDATADVTRDAPFVAPDTGPLVPGLRVTHACADIASALYRTPTGLPPFGAGVRGVLLGCAHRETITAESMRARLAGVPGVVITGGNVESYLIAYRTEREPRGVGGISTALVYVPDVAIGQRVPLVVAAHGSVGLDDRCAPSRLITDPMSFLPQSYVNALVLPWAARGMPVVVPDYAGLGTDGVHGYGNWLDPARSSIDGVRALRSMLPSDRLDGTTLVYGHSQGGGVALAIGALASEAPDVRIAAIVSMAPGYRAISLVDALRIPTLPLTPVLRGTVAFGLYADLANLTPDAARWGDAFAAGVRERVVTETARLCFGEQIAALNTASAGYTPPATLGDIIDPAFRTAALACADMGACDGLAGAWVARDRANEPHLSASAPPVLVVTSAADEVVSTGIVGCAVSRLVGEGATPDVCVVPEGSHLAMVSGTSAYAISWAISARSNAQRPPCAGDDQRPMCRLF